MTDDAERGLRVLIVDDDEDQRHLVRTLLARAGYDDVAEATNGAEALQVAAASQPDLVVLDLAMPVRSGVEILPELRDAVPEARIVVLSGMERRRVEHVVRHRGAVGFVEKRTPAAMLVRSILTAAALADETAASLSVSLPRESFSPRSARALVRDALHDDDVALVGDVELLVSELVTNAVLHASSAPTLAVHLSQHTIRVEVFDDDPTLPTLRTPDRTKAGGRGLLLLERLASRWGAERVDTGKLVWFELDRATSD